MVDFSTRPNKKYGRTKLLLKRGRYIDIPILKVEVQNNNLRLHY